MQKAQAPNYLYPLATTRQLQWTKDVVKGEKTAKQAIRPKNFSAPKKEIIQKLVKNQRPSTYGQDPMRAPDPRPGNAMHITNTVSAYNGYQA